MAAAGSPRKASPRGALDVGLTMTLWFRLSLLLLLVIVKPQLYALSLRDDLASSKQTTSPSSSSSTVVPLLDLPVNRRTLWAVAAAGFYVPTAGRLVRSLADGDLPVYPPAHEERVRDMITTALLAAAENQPGRVLRVLEVGMGTACRLIRRGLYDPALRALAAASPNLHRVEIVGLDLQAPSDAVWQDAQRHLQQQTVLDRARPVHLQFVTGSITDPLLWEPTTPSSLMITDDDDDDGGGGFDAILCCLTLCSVDDPVRAVQHMQRLLQQGGRRPTLGYVEHVAVNPDEPYRLLNWQQQILDPLQQAWVDHCHLHRYSDQIIQAVVFDQAAAGPRSPRFLQHERFLVKDMWPVSCQCSGVIQWSPSSSSSSSSA